MDNSDQNIQPQNSQDTNPSSSNTIEDIRLAKVKSNYEKFKEFITTTNNPPNIKSENADEKYLAQFYINRKSAKKSRKTDKWENDLLKEIEITYNALPEVFKKTKLCKLICILEFTKDNNRIPSQVSIDDLERDLGIKFTGLKANRNKMNAEELNILNKILEFKSRYMCSRKEKLEEVYKFCLDNEHTPRQHVENEYEKKMADFLSSTKSYLLKNTLPKDEMDIYNRILNYKRPDKNKKLKMLIDFCRKHKEVPVLSSLDENERSLAALLSKLKHLRKIKKIDRESDIGLTEIYKICDVKSRVDKLKELHQYIIKNNFPLITSDDETERKQAAMYTNTKRLMHLGKLNKEELDMFNIIFKMREK